MKGGALRGTDERPMQRRRARALGLAAVLSAVAAVAHADDGMIVIPGRGDTAEHALASANAASGGRLGANDVAPTRDAGNVTPAGPANFVANARADAAPGTRGNAAVVAPAAAAPRAADPGGIVTVVAGASDAVPNIVKTPPRAALATRAVPAVSATRPAAVTTAATAAPASPPPTQSAGAPTEQDPDTIRRAALAFLQQQIAGLPGKTSATVAPAFPRGLAACTTLEPFLPTGARLWGRTTVGVRCAGERPWTVYLQAKVTVHATYYVAARQIAPGEPLSAADLVARDGDLTVLPLAVITDPAQAIGATSLARIAAGLPLRQDMLKSAASVSAGQTVRVVAAGPGFTISAEGSALANAAPGQSVRVRMAAGQIVTAIVKDAGTVEIPL
ncbi:TPA: flagellar basal body P-ring formation protein FlgA [Burkholderia multivorans]|uniref:flagellar basal body P-ring formation chaperone FlgA n=1 Tax=Burkholderia multivorans TaxID=87883 RepID=UPI000CFE5D76|nr:flagellar basal body P-ring formation chaperone FlgA [Burkholderia multivorans]MBU9298809.1 flagellar basal body P-ring formation protein FlgA [Burkholderia multivorans]MBU9304931.1 flagellar basal body P-ring formation protein FlgA [Burkholderia multivorans]MBU9408116.1 flagellar basal body P-ring formation protein FlgA [Burkholderia multivorans]MBU9502367.1 flagellar basal body P-ring formation protein FlgA [Burkholderia multivorans]MBU9509536.1 flagellar basal body P-ring formation prote